MTKLFDTLTSDQHVALKEGDVSLKVNQKGYFVASYAGRVLRATGRTARLALEALERAEHERPA